MMDEFELAKKVVGPLDDGLGLIKQSTLNQLRSARQEALAHYQARQPAFDLAWAGHLSPRHAWHGARFWAAAITLILGLSAIAYWQAAQQNGDIEEIDAALLAGELPLHAYFDKDFDAWLESSSQ